MAALPQPPSTTTAMPDLDHAVNDERIVDWDLAYHNGSVVPNIDDFPPVWTAKASAYRDALSEVRRARIDLAYGPAPRERFDLFLPEGAPAGLLVFVHGGYWMSYDKSSWSHLAAGAVDQGWAAAMPSYSLCPEVTIPDITAQIGKAIAVAAREVAGPVSLAGHSAGGHLVSRMVCEDSPLDADLSRRIGTVVSISGVHDLRPLLRTKLNETLQLTPETAAAESPALNAPRGDPRVICWAGVKEIPEFRRQTSLLASLWRGFGLVTRAVESAGDHHFTVIDHLAERDSEMVALLTGAA
jgi:arylformamidase